MNSQTALIGQPAWYSDRDSLNFLMENLSLIGGLIVPISIRVHPSEKMENYDWALKAYDGMLRLSSNQRLVEDFATHEIVAGSNSAAMVHAANCGKIVLCCLNRSTKSPTIPMDGIDMLRDLQPRN